MLREFILMLAQLIDLLFTIYVYILVGRVLISWVNPDPYNPIVRFLRNVTDPLLNRIYRLVPLVFGGFDFTPLVLLLLLSFVQRLIVRALSIYANSLG